MHNLKDYNLLNEALTLHKQGQLQEAKKLYLKILLNNKNEINALNFLGTLEGQLGNYKHAIKYIEKAIALNPESELLYFNKAVALTKINCKDLAVENYEKAIKINLNYPQAHNNLATLQTEIGSINKAIYNYQKAIELKNDYYEAYNNLGRVYYKLMKYEEAAKFFLESININPTFGDALHNFGLLQYKCGNHTEAIKYYELAIKIEPKFKEAYFNCATLYLEKKELSRANLYLNKLLEIDIDYKYALEMRHHINMFLCDWEKYNITVEEIKKNIYKNKSCTPFPLVAFIEEAEAQLLAAQNFVNDNYPKRIELGEISGETLKNKIVLGYFSSDLCNHATAHLISEIFELHDRNTFEVVAFSFATEKDSDVYKNLKKSFDVYVDVEGKTDLEVAQISRNMGIDIAIDLNGHTRNARMGIFSYRAAPIQINYLGYPGTSAANYIDYIIADGIVVPQQYKKFYSERIMYMPGCYQPNRKIVFNEASNLTKNQFNLPENSFIFICHNSNYKITPDIFSCWMTILKRVPDSVLWLLEENIEATKNLKNEALKNDVSEERLIFAAKSKIEEHLKRQRLAHLFLDTYPCNAHTTASDALRMGLPVLTLIGETFPSRVAASLLTNLGLTELIAKSKDEYVNKAVELAQNSESLNYIKNKLLFNINVSELFNPLKYTQNLEQGFKIMFKKLKNKIEIEDIYIDN